MKISLGEKQKIKEWWWSRIPGFQISVIQFAQLCLWCVDYMLSPTNITIVWGLVSEKDNSSMLRTFGSGMGMIALFLVLLCTASEFNSGVKKMQWRVQSQIFVSPYFQSRFSHAKIEKKCRKQKTENSVAFCSCRRRWLLCCNIFEHLNFFQVSGGCVKYTLITVLSSFFIFCFPTISPNVASDLLKKAEQHTGAELLINNHNFSLSLCIILHLNFKEPRPTKKNKKEQNGR